jgi:predicted nucleic acid-binding protein
MLTCEAVLSEACFLLRKQSKGIVSIFELLRRDAIRVPFRLTDNLASLADFIRKYDNVPMSLADACLVRMAEILEESSILTLDEHFRLYRKNKRQVIPLLIPPGDLKD